jgi:hypothetical protein
MTPLTTLAHAFAIGGLMTAMVTTDAPVFAGEAVSVQQPAHQEHHPEGAQAEVKKQEDEMVQMHQKMMADMEAMDDQLSGLLRKMNAAEGDAKIDVMAELLTTLVEQRRVMRERMMQMRSKMMGHMMQHMSAAGSPEGKKMMMECPMMKQMGGGNGR